jgi:hypothetical protein
MPPSFFFCTDPHSTFYNGVSHFIYHAAKPRFFAVVQPLDRNNHSLDYNVDGLNILFRYVDGGGNENMYLIIVQDNIDKSMTPLISLLFEAASYYVSIIDEQNEAHFNRRGVWTIMPDYNKYVTDVKLLHIKKSNNYLLTYRGGIRTFRNEEAVQNFIHKVLNYSKEELKNSVQTMW